MVTAPAAKHLDRRFIFSADPKFAVNPNGQDRPTTLSGYALVWNVLSSDRGGYKVRLLPGSATFVRPTLALYHHEYADVIGNTANNTLRVFPDDYGVRVEIDLPETSLGRDVAELVGKGYLRGMSFGMVDDPTGKEIVEGGTTI